MKKTKSGKAEFSAIVSTYVDITEATANVTYLSHAIQNKWGSDHVIVSSDGLPIDDCSGTQGT